MALPQATLDRFQKCIDRLNAMKNDSRYDAHEAIIDARIIYYQNLIDEHS